ncbi:FxsA family protein [Paenibacillus sediminis]|uniref:UPF0716 protein FxsA n=1 Tax=Paenibacillus sediminis TaxID=664909 RepID=A0ABS4H5K6_9BACL|nr:FxsA family protein [Paenibacillus sediminis]MBP1937809.1 UPF0716 protein FxsA [Paenibacillus sediminis]
MLKWLIAAVIVIPLLEFYGFVTVGEHIGAGKTILLTFVTSIIGMAMMKFEGRKVLQDAKLQMNSGQIPGRTLLDGLCIFAGGILLMIPGFFTDIVGFTLIFPLTRPLYRYFLLRWIEKKMKNGSITFYRK